MSTLTAGSFKVRSALFSWLIGLIAAAHFGLFVYFLVATAVSSPISDMFAYIDAYLRYRAGEVSLVEYLWRAHGEHHLVWTRLLTWADVARFGTRGIPFMAAATAAITSTVAIVSWQLFCALQSKITRPIPMNGTSTSSGWFHKSDQTPDMAPIINAVDRTTQNCPRTERT
jgi:hypothetical protein